MTPILRAEGVSLGYGQTPIIENLDLTIVPGAITVIVGANASGKSTLLKGLSRLITPDAGQVTLRGRNIRALPAKKVATVVGLLPQQPVAPDGITVADLVGRGRYPHQGWFRQWSSSDDEIVAAAMAATNTHELAARRLEDLSGGQRQRVWIAMALAQDPEILLLDEPTTFLDVTHQIEVLDLLLERNRERGTTVVMVLHDLNLAARYADHLVVMCAGRIVANGTPAETLTAEIVRHAFDLEARIVPDPVCGSPMVVPIGRFHGVASTTTTPGVRHNEPVVI
ncbi:ABC transporter ATP-binding protein [Cryobacterium luteum]|uniref:ABC transporter ATP-binding protein n=1 Tax=Cryobacterium luteum TaxID=1424661 RepID=A0A1H8J2B2_9MICO|nr:ABC transporter ATP-binding protein [Cryobacterium luteum]TFB93291.1 ABC transporter ATP-binding protein [Cryobacterium luteum]SEN74862.1 iron complex transport system ATP-binding protein [Cryobacterium luteum]